MSEAHLETLPARERQWQRTHRRILAAATVEFERVGVAASRVEHICRAAEIARPTFYAHFPSKDDVLLELQRSAAAAVAEQITAQMVAAASLRDVVDVLIDGLFAASAQISERLRREILSMFVRKQSVADWEGSELHGALLHAVATARDTGAIAAQHDPEAVTRWLLGMLLVFLVAEPDDLEHHRSEARRFFHVLVAGLRD